MSILIKGMEMPSSCGDCAIKSWDGEDDVCPFSGISALSIGRQDDCPLVPVPKHGRLIDVDALEHIIGQFSFSWEYGQGVSDCWDALIAAPTIIEAEEGE